MKDRGIYFWKTVHSQLQAGHSITEVAASVNSTFDEIWNYIKQNRNMSRYMPSMMGYLEREANVDASRRLLKHWNNVVRAYTNNFKRMPGRKHVYGENPQTLSIRWGVKPSMIEQRLRDAGVLRESLTAINMVLNGADIDTVVETLLW